MNLVSVDSVAKSAGDRVLFENLSFGLEAGEKSALIGPNGSGKTTLLRLIARREEPDAGRITARGGSHIAFLEQSPRFDSSHSVREHVFLSESPLVRLIDEYESACEKGENLHDISERMQHKGAFEYESYVKNVLMELGIDDMSRKMGSLSGGLARKVALAQALIDPSDLLILDEPTNHLDMETIEWLEAHLKKMKSALLLVTHDRYFLDNVAERIYELHEGGLHRHDGSYGFYLERRAEREEFASRRKKKLARFLKSEMVWLRGQPKARGTKPKARIERIVDALQKTGNGKGGMFEFSVSGRKLGKRVLEVKNVSKSLGGRLLFEGFSLSFQEHERLGLVGPNGCGKSTLLNVLSGSLEPDTGSVTPGLNTHFGFFRQDHPELKGEERVLSFIRKNAEESIRLTDGTVLEASRLLEYFHFDSRMQSAFIGRLSGGEVRRLYLVYCLMSDPNFLLLDEPSNDLDVSTLSLLEDFLEHFRGCLVVVSHDRYFLDRVSDGLLCFDDEGRVGPFPGGASDYLLYRRESRREAKLRLRDGKERKVSFEEGGRKRKFSYRERREFEELGREIERLEREREDLERKLHSGERDHEMLAEWGRAFTETEARLNENLNRWMELADSVESTD